MDDINRISLLGLISQHSVFALVTSTTGGEPSVWFYWCFSVHSFPFILLTQSIQICLLWESRIKCEHLLFYRVWHLRLPDPKLATHIRVHRPVAAAAAAEAQAAVSVALALDWVVPALALATAAVRLEAVSVVVHQAWAVWAAEEEEEVRVIDFISDLAVKLSFLSQDTSVKQLKIPIELDIFCSYPSIENRWRWKEIFQQQTRSAFQHYH